jgi:hypothetical protein
MSKRTADQVERAENGRFANVQFRNRISSRQYNASRATHNRWLGVECFHVSGSPFVKVKITAAVSGAAGILIYEAVKQRGFGEE